MKFLALHPCLAAGLQLVFGKALLLGATHVSWPFPARQCCNSHPEVEQVTNTRSPQQETRLDGQIQHLRVCAWCAPDNPSKAPPAHRRAEQGCTWRQLLWPSCCAAAHSHPALCRGASASCPEPQHGWVTRFAKLISSPCGEPGWHFTRASSCASVGSAQSLANPLGHAGLTLCVTACLLQLL